MRKNLDEINKDILEKIDNMDIEDNIKNFLKEALFIEFNNRDKNFDIKDERNEEYQPIINDYYKGE